MPQELVGLFVRSMGLGLAVAAPVGPMSLLCMRRSLAQGWRSGLATGAGIAVGDGAYALVAALGLTGVSTFLLAHERPLHLVAGLVLVYLGLRTFGRDQAGAPVAASLPGSLGASFMSSVLLTLTNPPTILMFAAIFTALTPPDGLALATAAVTVAGVCAGSLAWWCGVVATMSAFGQLLSPTARTWIDRSAGTVLAILGLAELRRAL
jgi:threonine/homoserine/homoserine lactone efflux protein